MFIDIFKNLKLNKLLEEGLDSIISKFGGGFDVNNETSASESGFKIPSYPPSSFFFASSCTKKTLAPFHSFTRFSPTSGYHLLLRRMSSEFRQSLDSKSCHESLGFSGDRSFFLPIVSADVCFLPATYSPHLRQATSSRR